MNIIEATEKAKEAGLGIGRPVHLKCGMHIVPSNTWGGFICVGPGWGKAMQLWEPFLSDIVADDWEVTKAPVDMPTWVRECEERRAAELAEAERDKKRHPVKAWFYRATGSDLAFGIFVGAWLSFGLQVVFRWILQLI